MKKIIILFTRVPKVGITKTRLYDFLTASEAVDIQKKLLKKLYYNFKKWNYDVKIFHSEDFNSDEYMRNILEDENLQFYYQSGNTLGDKMFNAINEISKLNSNSKILLIGSDVVGITEEILNNAFSSLDKNDVVINPTYDGGYYLIGMKKAIKEIFNIEQYGTNTVLENTLLKLKNENISYCLGEYCLDIDTKEDLLTYETNFKNISLLGAGEYNINFLYDYSETEKRILRLNMKSQMNLKEQMKYEYHTLKILENSTVTPKVYDLEENPKIIPYKYLTMEYLKGRPLNYYTDMDIAAYLLSKIHNTKYTRETDLIFAKNPFLLMYEECNNMASEYLKWDNADSKVKDYLLKFLRFCEKKININYEISNMCIINTELNSGNFIIGDKKENSYVIDWEKALIGECEQDLAHFLAPTTTFWKTDVILSNNEINNFLLEYKKYRNFDREKFDIYLVFTCLRGITWCSMAFRQYSEKEKLLTDEFTFNKIKKYLEYSFLENLEKYFND